MRARDKKNIPWAAIRQASICCPKYLNIDVQRMIASSQLKRITAMAGRKMKRNIRLGNGIRLSLLKYVGFMNIENVNLDLALC
jgi:hypothetical protein